MDKTLKDILLEFQIKPIVVNKVTPKLYHVRDGVQEYALKKTKLDTEKLKHWEAMYRFSITNNISAVLPVYVTKNGSLYSRYNQDIYYVSPWVDVPREERYSQRITDFYTSLAKLHSTTKREHKVEIEKITEQFNTFQNYCNELRANLLTLVRQFERSSYMSPIELLVCTQFRDLEQAFIEIEKRVHRFITDHEEGTITWSSALCHRNLNESHIRGNFFVNWESAGMDHPVMDLISFFNREIGTFQPQSEKFIELFPTYMKLNKLNLHELQYFSIYMLSPADYIQTIQDYVKGKRNESMIDLIREIQHKHRKVLFGLSWSRYIEDEYETLNFDELES